MRTREQLESALRNAHGANDSAAALRFATAIREQDYELNHPETETQPLDQNVDYNIGTAIGNIPESASNTIKDIYNAFRHPQDTIIGINNVVSGAINKFTPGLQSSEKYADAAGEMIKQDYGSWNKFKQHAMDDPVGVVGDVASIVSGGSLVVPKYGAKLNKMAGAIDPLNVAVSGASKLAMNAPLTKNIPRSMYKSSAKFNKKFDANAVTETALRERIMPTDGGISKALNKVSDIDMQIDGLIDASVDSGQRIPRTKLYQHLKQARRKLGGVNLEASDNLKKLNKVVGDFEIHMKGLKGKDQLTAREVQDFKKNIYQTIQWKKNQGTGSQAKSVTRKSIARGAKDELERIMPEIKGFNLKQGEMIELLDAIDAPAARIQNKDMSGIGLPLKVMAGEAAAGGIGSFIGFVLGLADSPKIKARIAIGLNDIKRQSISDARKRVLALELLKSAGSAGQNEKVNPSDE